MGFFRFLLALLMFLRLLPAPVAVLPDYREVTVSFVGDCMIASSKGQAGRGSLNWYALNYEPSYFLEKVAPYFESDDITVVNCETVLTDRELPERVKSGTRAYWYRGPAANARIFSAASVEVAGIANNHSMDYGEEGRADTVAALKAQGIEVAEDNVPVYYEAKGVTVGILACQLWYPGAERSYYAALREMNDRADIQIIYAHGGGENTYEVDDWRVTAFHNLIDRGADLCLCSHAHRLQPTERYKDAAIVYGLGNFCYGGRTNPVNRTVIYRADFRLGANGGLTLTDEIVPCYVYTGPTNNWQPAPIDPADENYQKILDFMSGKLETPE